MLPTYSGSTISAAEQLQDPAVVLADLRTVNWAFDGEDTAFLAHDVHPYPAKFIPQIPGHLISRLSLPGDVVLDPFGGSGTTALEAVRLGRRAVSVDANPLAALIGAVKTASLSAAALDDVEVMRSTVAAHIQSRVSASDLLAQHGARVPQIVHVEKWFSEQSVAELACLRDIVESAATKTGREIGLLALSRTVQNACFQDSETRYASKPRDVTPDESFVAFLRNLARVVESVGDRDGELRNGVATFITGDARAKLAELPDCSVDLAVTSPPYGNAYDYHLYLRFRLLWLGYDPKELARQEIGSHLRHQRERTGFDHYMEELGSVLTELGRVLRPGRYAALVIGDPVYGGKTYSISRELEKAAGSVGMGFVGCIRRPIHGQRRSVAGVARRAEHEDIIVLQRAPRPTRLVLQPPPYGLWPYETRLRADEARVLVGAVPDRSGALTVEGASDSDLHVARRLTFTHELLVDGAGTPERTWQAILENGSAQLADVRARKDPKYVTHGLHEYKGKFYPQLAKALMNRAVPQGGKRVLDPFCGSGTTLLEAYLGGNQAYGMDMNPLAARVASAKVGVLEYSPTVVEDTCRSIVVRLTGWELNSDNSTLDQFAVDCHDEILSWFAEPVAYKLNAVLGAIRSSSSGALRDFLESVFSSIVRDVSHQEPRDLRIRRRKERLTDADVIGLYLSRLESQLERLRRFWRVKGYCPHLLLPAVAKLGDSRDWSDLCGAGFAAGEIDLVLTSPPYAVALPYIDTDRLSLLLLDGLASRKRRPIEHGLTGSREIGRPERDAFERIALGVDQHEVLSATSIDFLSGLLEKVTTADVGFRRKNMPALLTRYCSDMHLVLRNCVSALRLGGQAMIVIGDSRMSLDEGELQIPTTRLVKSIAEHEGMTFVESIPIDVTTDNSLHRRNSITKNSVLVFRRD